MSISRERERTKIESGDSMSQAEGYSALSSTYYSILGTGAAHLKKCLNSGWKAPLRLLFWLSTWLPLMLWCYFRMRWLSGLVVKAIGYEGMTASQCDIRATILRRSGCYYEAERCLMEGLIKSSIDDPPHVRGLLHINLAYVLAGLGVRNTACGEITKALEYARGSIFNQPKQAVRIYRQADELSKKLRFPLGEGVQKEYSLAKMLACSADQKLKAGFV